MRISFLTFLWSVILFFNAFHVLAGDFKWDKCESYSAEVNCYNQKYILWDNKLNNIYSAGMKYADNQDIGSREGLRKTERAWLRYRDANIALVTELSKRNPASSELIISEFRVRFVEERALNLINMLRGLGDPPDWLPASGGDLALDLSRSNTVDGCHGDYTIVELGFCIANTEDRLTEELNALYTKSMQLLSETEQSKMRESQRAWIQYRDVSFAQKQAAERAGSSEGTLFSSGVEFWYFKSNMLSSA